MSKQELAKAYEPHDVEARWNRAWEERGYYRPDPASDKQRFAMVIPPPNVTGSLHIGHAFAFTLQDVIVRWKRMCGLDVLWLPGLDHAGIATQTVVERQLAKEGLKKEDLGREAFEARVWKWKEESGGTITRQLRLMGFSLDWTRERFTLDAMLSKAVREVFVSLYEQGLIYRGQYIVNWCPRCVTALSDLEVETQPQNGHLWHIRYRAEGGGEGIVVATTRPETLLGDTAVAVHPDDERYRQLIGKKLVLPVLGRLVPVVADPFVDREFGTGAVKVTPAHDPNDFLAGQRLELASINIMDERGILNEQAGPYAGQERFAARKGIVAQLDEEGLLIKTQPYQVPLGHCQRCHTVVEPRLSWQWFVKTKPLAEPAIAAVEDGRIVFNPESWSKTYFEWMRNIRDWCISRQLWWGHRIPAWTCGACDEILVARQEPKTCAKCGGSDLKQETDVLDTWFSSALFPFSTMGWPEKTADLARYYPNDVMMTGFDIIFFWVARMVMMGMHFTGEVPFRQIFINGLVRDEKGEKMSKIKGNSIDPLELIGEHGADALRFTMAALAAPGTDPSLSIARLQGYQAFANKLWNASRFVLMNVEGGEVAKSYDPATLPLPSRWILGQLRNVVGSIKPQFDEFRFDLAANAIYHFIWDQFCDWYLEISKTYLADPERAPEARAVLLTVLETSLRLLHPIMPFITEEIWQRLPHEGETIMLAPFPQVDDVPAAPADQLVANQIFADVTRIRTWRSENGVDPKRKIDVIFEVTNLGDYLKAESDWVRSLARLNRFDIVRECPADIGRAIKLHGDTGEIHIPMAGLFDVAAEKTRLTKERLKIDQEIEGLRRKLDNPQFVERAKPEVVAESRERVAALSTRREKIEATLADLAGAA